MRQSHERSEEYLENRMERRLRTRLICLHSESITSRNTSATDSDLMPNSKHTAQSERKPAVPSTNSMDTVRRSG
jgi:hypothetical protein